MLSYEWRELEMLCDRISDLRHRYSLARRTSNAGLIAGLKDELAKAQRQRELLVQHISARLSAAAAERRHPAEATGRYRPARRRADDAQEESVASQEGEPLPEGFL